MDSKVGTALMPRAPKHCGINGCTEIVPAGKRCSQHQHRWPTRTGATRTSESGHKAWRAAVLKRDQYHCQLRYDSCIGSATEADHILATAFSGARYDLHNGQAACC